MQVKTGVVGNVGGVAFSSGTIDDVMMQFQFFATGQFGITSKTSTLGMLSQEKRGGGEGERR